MKSLKNFLVSILISNVDDVIDFFEALNDRLEAYVQKQIERDEQIDQEVEALVSESNDIADRVMKATQLQAKLS